MKVIYKYTCVPEVFDWVAQVPKGAEILSIGQQHYNYVYWALVDPAALPVPRRFRLVPTGQPFEDMPNAKYIGTNNDTDVGLVFHFFDLGECPDGLR